MSIQPRLFAPPSALTQPSDEWYTPQPIIFAARRAMGGIDLDPATSYEANKRVNARRIFTINDDGLSQYWSGNVWLNPPYSAPLPWITHLANAYKDNGITYIALVPERLGTKWFKIIVDTSAAMCMFTHDRIRFVRADGRGTSSPNFGNFAFYGGRNIADFRREFQHFGKVVKL